MDVNTNEPEHSKVQTAPVSDGKEQRKMKLERGSVKKKIRMEFRVTKVDAFLED